jgi:galactan 5-O-arabinofuranosyltransferase
VLSLEAGVGVLAIVAYLVLALSIRINPMVRVGQISGLASLQLRFLAIAIPLLVIVMLCARLRGGRHFQLAVRIACAALAGLASAFVAGGVIVALRHTPYCLNAHNRDSGLLAAWANAFSTHDPGGYPPPFYPPAFPHLLAWYKDLTGQPALYALKDLQIAITALVGPAAYICWRRLLPPMWALAIGGLSILVLVEPYKPYEGLVLVMLVPVLIQLAQALRTAEDRTIQDLAKGGVGYGVVPSVLGVVQVVRTGIRGRGRVHRSVAW